MHIPSGVILEGDLPELPDTVEDIPDEEWRPVGEIDPVTGRPEIDWRRASRWRSLGEFLRWR